MAKNHKPRPNKTVARRELAQRTDVRCLCGKVWSPSRSQAKKLYRKIERRTHTTDKVWFYDCEFGGHHWTRMPPDRWPPPQENV